MKSDQPTSGSSRFVEEALWLVVSVGAVLIPLTIDVRFVEAFRQPKELAYIAEAILLLAGMGILLLHSARATRKFASRHSLPLSVVALALLWTSVTTLTSTNTRLSVSTLVWVAACSAVVTATLFVAGRRGGMLLAYAAIAPALLNAVLAIVQRLEVYQPWTYRTALPIRMRTTALVGNPNDVGTYLLWGALAALALARTSEHRQRQVVFYGVAAMIIAGMIAAESVAALGALAAATAVLFLLPVTRTFPLRVVALCAVVAVVIALVTPLRQRAVTMTRAYVEGDYVRLSSMRLPAFAVAWQMFRDRPLTGFGPGTYGWWYMDYKTRLDAQHPSFLLLTENFGEAHNDHLQTLAVAGAPGYAILLLAVVVVGSRSTRRSPANHESVDRAAFARMLALPLSVAFAVAALAQFPLELAATTSAIFHYAALCCAWTTN